ncbi:acetyl-CoA carboxylase biotin carboxyl carrier protein subunit [Phreatobacter aquaticus]|nr:acetyl-CoA carboxylase biotin carboxyl carrier protein subunit [Phreatobacter aquaticus]
MRHAFDIDGTETEVWLARDGQAYRLEGDAGRARVSLDGQGLDRELSVDSRREPVLMVIEGEVIHLHLGGRTYQVRHLDPARRFADADDSAGGDVARAPMPGTVVRVDVAVGDAVTTGDPLVVIESMKLETTIRAWHDGVIAELHVAAGQSFDRDAPLVTLGSGAV